VTGRNIVTILDYTKSYVLYLIAWLLITLDDLSMSFRLF